MPIELVNVGSLPNDGQGDPLRVAYQKINQSLTYLASLPGQAAPLVNEEAEARYNADQAIIGSIPGAISGGIDGRLADETTPDADAQKLSTPADVVRRAKQHVDERLIDTPLSGTTSIANLKGGDIQNLWTDTIVNQIVSNIKGESYLKSFEQIGTGVLYSTSDEPLHRSQSFSEVNVYNASAPDGYKGMTTPVTAMGEAHQCVIGPNAFDKIAGHFIELHDKAPNGGEHYAQAIHLYQHADRKDPSDTNPNTGGFFSINGVADDWVQWLLLADMGHHANGFVQEINIRNEWGVRPDSSSLATIPATDLGFQFGTMYSTDFSQYHITRAVCITASNAWGVTQGDPSLLAGWHTGIYVSGYANHGIVFGPSVHYNNPHDRAGSVTSPSAITFANDDTDVMSFWSDGAAAWSMVRLYANQLGFVRNSDGNHFMAMDRYSGETYLGNGNVVIDMAGAVKVKDFTQDGALYDGGALKVSPLTGANVSFGTHDTHIVIDPAGALAVLTVTLPPSPGEGRIVEFTFTQDVTTLTVVGGTGGAAIANNVSSASAGTVLGFKYFLSSNAWYRS